MSFNFLPEAVEDIIFKYEHQMKMKNVMDELLETTSYVNQCCNYCRINFCSTKINKCSTIGCEKTLCNKCYQNEISILRVEQFFERFVENNIRDNNQILCNTCSIENIRNISNISNSRSEDSSEELNLRQRYARIF